jgi:hypothetical protein
LHLGLEQNSIMLLHLSRTFLPFFLNIVAALERLHSAAELWPLYPCFGITMMSNSFGPARTYNSEADSEVRFKISCSTLSLALIAGGSRAIRKLTSSRVETMGFPYDCAERQQFWLGCRGAKQPSTIPRAKITCMGVEGPCG